MLREHGTMDAVEVRVAKYKKEEEEEKLEGGVYTKIDLEKEGWTTLFGCVSFVCLYCFELSAMIDSSKEWARSRGLLWTSEVHGAEEWRIPLKRRFKKTETKGSEMKEKASAMVQDHALVCVGG